MSSPHSLRYATHPLRSSLIEGRESNERPPVVSIGNGRESMMGVRSGIPETTDETVSRVIPKVKKHPKTVQSLVLLLFHSLIVS